MTDQEVLLVLNASEGLGARKIRALYEAYGSYQEVIRVVGGIAQKEKFLQAEQQRLLKKGIKVITCVDDKFPSALKSCPDAPVVLYVWGDVNVLNRSSVAIVGSRHAGVYGVRIAKQFAATFSASDEVIVSGLARGIDAAAHEGCLSVGGITVGVVGCGLDIVYPAEHRLLFEKVASQGAVVSEYAMLTKPYPYNFPWRNRIISGLSKATVVIEAQQNSGALITATYAADQGKEVFVVPANIDNPVAVGSNELIRDGAQVALSAHDVLQALGKGSVKIKQELTASENQANLAPDVIKALNAIGSDAVHIDQLLVKPCLSVNKWRLVLLDLELKGFVRQLPGQFYIKV